VHFRNTFQEVRHRSLLLMLDVIFFSIIKILFSLTTFIHLVRYL
jgi:hypothetical protein